MIRAFLLGVALALSGCNIRDRALPVKEDVVEKHTIVVGFDDSREPFMFRDADGMITGLAVEYFALAAKKAGIKVQVVLYSSALEAERLFRAGKIDILPFVSKTVDREGFMLFTPEYVHVGTTMLISGSQLTMPMTVAYGRRQSIEPYILQLASQLDLKPQAHNRESFAALLTGEVNAAIMNMAEAKVLQKRWGARFTHSQVDFMNAWRMAVHPEQRELHDALTRGLNQITDEERAAINKKWLPPRLATMALVSAPNGHNMQSGP